MSVEQQALRPQERLVTVGVGLIANKAFTLTWNYGVYPLALWFGGILWGSILMLVLNFGANYGTLRLYDWSRRDWLGIETIKEVRHYEGRRFAGKLLARSLRAGDPIAVAALSVFFDPFVTTAYMRRGAHRYDGMSRRDWAIFLISFAISTIYWLALVYAGISGVEALWNS